MAFLETISTSAGQRVGRVAIQTFQLIARNFAKLEPAVQDSGAADYIPALTDRGRVVTRSRATAQTVTLPQNSAVAFEIGAKIEFIQSGAGALTFQAGAGATVNRAAFYTLVANGQYSRVTAIKVAANTWNLSGGLTAA